ncbi:MAG TPA: DNA repair protein RecN [bacterium]|nr:DNA repair protein RecN [bacterium]
MLRELRVTDYAIIDKLAVHFDPGLNILTGETGAGKSIIVGALSFALGERVSEDVIRKGAAACRVEAVFDLSQSKPRSGDAQVTIAREISRDGRSKCSASGKSISLTALRELGNDLVDFHGQHEHQVILNVASHIDFLDDFGGLHAARNELAAKRRCFLEASRRLASLRGQIDELRTKEDFIRHEIEEIETLGLKANEDAQIEQDIKVLANAEKIIQVGSEATEMLYDSEDAAIKLVSRARLLLEKLAPYSADFASLGESLDQAHMIVKEVGESLRDSLGRIDLDASRLEYLRERGAAIERVKRKFGKSVDEVLAHLKGLKAGLANRDDLEAEVKRLDAERARLAREVVVEATALSRKRKTIAERFQKLVETELKSLGMEGGAFRVVFELLEDGEPIAAGDEPIVVGEKGIDTAEFFIRTNKGEDLLPLRRIASGGEISRVMLALKRVLAEVDRVGALVFDEIDAGIGGSIASVVAAKLREVANARQVICITHLPQIAAAADLHLAVDKATSGGRTVTEVTEVEGEGRVRELARMLAGSKPSRSAVAHAEEMLKRSASR